MDNYAYWDLAWKDFKMSLQFFEEKKMFLWKCLFIFLLLYCVQKYCVWRCPKGNEFLNFWKKHSQYTDNIFLLVFAYLAIIIGILDVEASNIPIIIAFADTRTANNEGKTTILRLNWLKIPFWYSRFEIYEEDNPANTDESMC